MSDKENLVKLLENCNKSQCGIYHETTLEETNVYIMIKKPFAPRYLKLKKYRTIDIVQIGWIPYISLGKDLTEKPKNIFDENLNVILDWCKQNNFNLYIECISSEKLIEYYLKKGFQKSDNDPNSLLYVFE